MWSQICEHETHWSAAVLYKKVQNLKKKKNYLIFFIFFLLFLPVTFKLAYFALLNGAGGIFPVNFNYQRCLENSTMIIFWLTCWSLCGDRFFLVFFSHFFAHNFEFSLLCTTKWCGSNFPVTFNYQSSLENSNMINFWLTSWVTLW